MTKTVGVLNLTIFAVRDEFKSFIFCQLTTPIQSVFLSIEML